MRGDLAAVCCYFNPCHYQTRRANYLRFRENVTRGTVELVTVELAFADEPFELEPSPGTIQLRGADVMWQKERLLAIGLAEAARRGHAKLAWLDADVLFDEPAPWAERVSRALDRAPLVQVFSRVRKRGPEGRLPGAAPAAVRYHQQTGAVTNYPGAPGFGWAVRAEVLEAVPLYQQAILGGGDSLVHMAGYCFPDRRAWWRKVVNTPLLRAFNSAMREHYAEWAERWGALIRGEAGCVDQGITTLYHGQARNRQYIARFEILGRHAFDPARDIAAGEGQGWRWATEKTALHREVRDYFSRRREDEPAPHALEGAPR